VLRALVMLFANHAPPCRNGNTPLKLAVGNAKLVAAAFLLSVSSAQLAQDAPQMCHFQ
jgi:hypothetical protein